MKSYLASALALCLAFAPLAPSAAWADEASQFRTVAAQPFSDADLQRYGLSGADRRESTSLPGARVRSRRADAGTGSANRRGSFFRESRTHLDHRGARGCCNRGRCRGRLRRCALLRVRCCWRFAPAAARPSPRRTCRALPGTAPTTVSKCFTAASMRRARSPCRWCRTAKAAPPPAARTRLASMVNYWRGAGAAQGDEIFRASPPADSTARLFDGRVDHAGRTEWLARRRRTAWPRGAGAPNWRAAGQC